MFTKRYLKLSTTAALALLLTVWSCAHRPETVQPEGVPSELESIADTALFSALIRTLSDSLPEPGEILRVGTQRTLRASAHPLRVDPRSLTSEVHFGIGRLAAIPAEVVATRAEVLDRLGIPEVDALAPRYCAPWTAFAGAPAEEREQLSRGCPKDTFFLIAIAGTPRFGEAAWSHRPEDSAEEARLGHWSIMVMEVPMTPTGTAITFTDYVFKRSDDGKGWQFVKSKGLFSID
jgi:hypothetical protein